METKERIKIKLLYIGETFSTEKKKVQQFYCLPENYKNNKTLDKSWRNVCFIKLLKYGAIGSIYEVEATPDGKSVFTGMHEYVSDWHNRDEIARWKIESDSFNTAIKAKKAEEGAAKFSEAFARLEPLRAAYNRMSPPHQAAFLALVIRKLTQSSPIGERNQFDNEFY